MTIRELQYAIQAAIDETAGITDNAEVCIGGNAVGCVDIVDGKKVYHTFGTVADGNAQLSAIQIKELNELAELIDCEKPLLSLEEMDYLNPVEMLYLKDVLSHGRKYGAEMLRNAENRNLKEG